MPRVINYNENKNSKTFTFLFPKSYSPAYRYDTAQSLEFRDKERMAIASSGASNLAISTYDKSCFRSMYDNSSILYAGHEESNIYMHTQGSVNYARLYDHSFFGGMLLNSSLCVIPADNSRLKLTLEDGSLATIVCFGTPEVNIIANSDSVVELYISGEPKIKVTANDESTIRVNGLSKYGSDIDFRSKNILMENIDEGIDVDRFGSDWLECIGPSNLQSFDIADLDYSALTKKSISECIRWV